MLTTGRFVKIVSTGTKPPVRSTRTTSDEGFVEYVTEEPPPVETVSFPHAARASTATRTHRRFMPFRRLLRADGSPRPRLRACRLRDSGDDDPPVRRVRGSRRADEPRRGAHDWRGADPELRADDAGRGPDRVVVSRRHVGRAGAHRA